ncbi:MAG: pilus assembly protein TadG-related protein [Actinomycetes bacterium]
MRRDDSGQLLLLVLVYFLIAAAVVMVVTDVSKVYLARRALASTADGAAIAAVQAINRAAFYRDGASGDLRIDPAAAQAAIESYADRNGLAARFTDLTLDDPQISADGTTVRVGVHCRVLLPFTGFFTGGARSVNVDAEASARTATV